MKFVEIQELRPLLAEKWSATLFMEAMRLHKIPTPSIVRVSRSHMEEEAAKHIATKEWDPNKTLVIYKNPTPISMNAITIDENATGIEIMAQELDGLNGDACTCVFFSDMTLERLTDMVNQLISMRAFL